MVKKCFQAENTFFFENVENIGKVKSGIRNYFHSPKIIFEKKNHFRSNTSRLPTRADFRFFQGLENQKRENPYSLRSTRVHSTQICYMPRGVALLVLLFHRQSFPKQALTFWLTIIYLSLLEFRTNTCFGTVIKVSQFTTCLILSANKMQGQC